MSGKTTNGSGSEKQEMSDLSGYEADISAHFDQMSEIVAPLIDGSKELFSKIENALYTLPAFVNAIRAAVPEVSLQAVMTNKQKQQLRKGVVQLMCKKDGSLLANLIDPKTKKIITKLPLKEVKVTPEMSRAMAGLSMQMQMAQIAQQIQMVQYAIEEVRKGQEYDRLATAYSCQQRFLQAMKINNPELRTMSLLHLVASAEDSRNLLMLSQKSGIAFIMEQPETLIRKVLSGAAPDKIDDKMNEIRESLCAINMVSIAEVMAYYELGEYESARMSLNYYSKYIDDTYMSVPGLVERLDSIDPAPENYWTKLLPEISKKIKMLPTMYDTKAIEVGNSRGRKNK